MNPEAIPAGDPTAPDFPPAEPRKRGPYKPRRKKDPEAAASPREPEKKDPAIPVALQGELVEAAVEQILASAAGTYQTLRFKDKIVVRFDPNTKTAFIASCKELAMFYEVKLSPPWQCALLGLIMVGGAVVKAETEFNELTKASRAGGPRSAPFPFRSPPAGPGNGAARVGEDLVRAAMDESGAAPSDPRPV